MNDEDFYEVVANCEAWQKAVERLQQKNVDQHKVFSYFNERHSHEPIDAQTPIGSKDNSLKTD